MSPSSKRSGKRSGDADPVPAIDARKLTKRYGSGTSLVKALDRLDFRVEKGEMVAIMGPSGSGKSTLLHLLGALETPTSGTIALAGENFEGLDDRGLTLLRREKIGFVFQFFNLLPSLNALENVMLPALIAGRRDPKVEKRARRRKLPRPDAYAAAMLSALSTSRPPVGKSGP